MTRPEHDGQRAFVNDFERDLVAPHGHEHPGFVREGPWGERWIVAGEAGDSALTGLLSRAGAGLAPTITP